MDRRSFLALLSGTAGGIAGCTTGHVASPSPTDAGPSGSLTPTAGALDLREANVTAVALEGRDDGVRFDVTLYHDDDGEEGYANWWQIERRDGTRLGRRELLHAHGTREFTRSATIAVPDGTACVVVRGHDQTHGYGGRAMLAAIDSGTTRGVDQGPEPRSFDTTDCP